MYTASAGPVRRRCPPGYLHAHPLPLGSPGAYHACTGLSNDARLAREQPSGDLHAAQITLSPPPPPICASLCSQCPVDVVRRRVSIVSRVPGFRGPRVKGFLGQNGLKGTKGPGASGFQGKVFFFQLKRSWLQRSNMSKFFKIFKVLGCQVAIG